MPGRMNRPRPSPVLPWRMPALPPSVVRTAAAGALVLLLVGACDGTVVAPSGTGLGETPSADGRPTVDPGAEPSDFLAAAARGPWRPRALAPTAGFLDTFEAACATQEPALRDPPVALREVRGRGLATAIFGEANSAGPAWLCRGPLDPAGAGTVEVVELDAGPEPIRDEAIDIVRYEVVVDPGGDSRTVLIGRVGRSAVGVRATFPDVTEVDAAVGGGWYAAWWPGAREANGVAAVNRQNLAVGAVAPPGPPAQP